MKCAIVGCQRKVIGDFQHMIDTETNENPNEQLLGEIILWCALHEDSLQDTLGTVNT